MKKLKQLKQFFYMLIGIPDYENYLSQLKIHHPDKKPMTDHEYFRNRVNARFTKKSGCC